MSKLIDLHMDWETFNKLPALEQSGAANIYEGIFLKKISNVDLNTLSFLSKVSIWDAWLGPPLQVDTTQLLQFNQIYPSGSE